MTKNTQPAIMTQGVSIFNLIKDEFNIKFNEHKFFAGHSLGEYSAFVCSNSLEKAAIFIKGKRKINARGSA